MPDSPNILFIAVDDLFEFTAFRNSFGVEIQTPNMDRLLEKSAHFENAFATTPVCNPSRTSSLTGKSPFETNVLDNVAAWHEENPIEESLPAALKDDGYHTASAGKIFHGYKPQPDFVNDRVFSEDVPDIRDSFDGNGGVSNGGGWQAKGYTGADDQFYDHKVASWGVEFLEEYDQDDPFMLMLGFKHPHNNFEAPQQYYDLYDLDQIKVPDSWVAGDLSDAPAFAQQFMHKGQFFPDKDLDQWKGTVEGYLAAISHADAQIGRVLDALDASDHANNTAILLHSDHGFQLGDKDHFGKFTLWEESAKAPLFLHLPGMTEGTTISTPVSLIDIMPTLLDLAGADPAPYAIGESLMPLVDDDYGTHSGGPVFTQVYGSLSIRDGDMRFIRYADGSEELYDTATDPGQNTNLANDPAYTGQLETLRDTLWDEAAIYGLTTNDDDATLTGTEGRDVLMAQPETETLEGGAGDDIYFLYDNTAEVIEAEDGGHDLAYLSGLGPIDLPDNVEDGFIGVVVANERIKVNGNDLDNTFWTQGASVELYAGAGDDIVNTEQWSGNRIWGEDGNDILKGGNWSDRLDGGTGNDTLIGGRGTDFLKGGEGADQMDGGAGFDTVDYKHADSAIYVNLHTGRGYGGEAQGDRLTGIERVWGSQHNDTIMGDHSINTLIGYNGDDYFNAFSGDDHVFGGNGNDIVVAGDGEDTVDAGEGDDLVSGGDGRDLVFGWDGNDKLIGGRDADTLVGERGDDTLLGQHGNDLLDGGEGADTLNGGDGNDRLFGGKGADILDGGEGADVADYSESEGDVYVNLNIGRGYGHDAQGDRLSNIEEVEGSAFNDTLMGSAGDDTLIGGAGDDYINASSGDDTLIGGAGADALIGSFGSDFVSYEDSAEGVVVQLALGRGWEGDAAGDSYHGIENATGSALDDTLIGNAQDNVFEGGAGNDYIHGGHGDDLLDGGAGADALVGGTGLDIVDYSASGSGVTVNLTDLTASGGDAEGDTFWAVEGLAGSAYDDDLTGAATSSGILGGDGDDKITIGRSDTAMAGGQGADSFIIDASQLGADSFLHIFDFNADVDSLVFKGAVTLTSLTTDANGTRIEIAGEDDIMALLTLDQVTLSEDDIVYEDDEDDPEMVF
ncbi:MAG: sulfatase-like hydrolase/transferase [Pseudomonadota bacterium]